MHPVSRRLTPATFRERRESILVETAKRTREALEGLARMEQQKMAGQGAVEVETPAKPLSAFRVSVSEECILLSSALFGTALSAIYESSFYRMEAEVFNANHDPLNPILIRELPLVLADGIPSPYLPGLEQMNNALNDQFAPGGLAEWPVTADIGFVIGVRYGTKSKTSELHFILFPENQLQLSGMSLDYHNGTAHHTHPLTDYQGKPYQEFFPGLSVSLLPSVSDLAVLLHFPATNPMHIFYVPMDLDFLAEELREGRLPDRAKIEALVCMALENEVVGIHVSAADRNTEPKILLRPIVHQ